MKSLNTPRIGNALGDTPRVDCRTVLTPVLGLEGDMHELVTADFARQLERENVAMREALEIIRYRAEEPGGMSAKHALWKVDAMRRAYEEGQK